MLNLIEYLNIPAKIAFILVAVILIVQIIGEIAELFGKVVPEFMKIRKYFKRKNNEKKEAVQTMTEVKELYTEVKTLLKDVNAHYSEDNISKRDKWMEWVNNRAKIYDSSIGEVGKISENLTNVTTALQECTKMTEEMFVQSSRDRIIDFASKVSDVNFPVTKEEFSRIFKVYKRYEEFLKEHKMTNGEVDISYRIIKDAYEEHLKNHTFVEDVRGYDV